MATDLVDLDFSRPVSSSSANPSLSVLADLNDLLGLEFDGSFSLVDCRQLPELNSSNSSSPVWRTCSIASRSSQLFDIQDLDFGYTSPNPDRSSFEPQELLFAPSSPLPSTSAFTVSPSISSSLELRDVTFGDLDSSRACLESANQGPEFQSPRSYLLDTDFADTRLLSDDEPPPLPLHFDDQRSSISVESPHTQFSPQFTPRSRLSQSTIEALSQLSARRTLSEAHSLTSFASSETVNSPTAIQLHRRASSSISFVMVGHNMEDDTADCSFITALDEMSDNNSGTLDDHRSPLVVPESDECLVLPEMDAVMGHSDLHDDGTKSKLGPKADVVDQEFESAHQDNQADESDDEEMVAKPKRVSQRKQAEKLALDGYVHDDLLRKARSSTKEMLRTLESHSTDWLVKQANENIISSPREYQVELFEMAKKKNVIAVLDTGSGKTLIAVLLLRHIINQELEDRAMGKPRRISFFLVHSVTLVFQQFAVLECNLDQPMDKFCGGMGCDLWTKKHWESQFETNMVVVCTAEVLHHCLHHGFITMAQINLLVFDEAHHAKKDHAYARIIKDFYASATADMELPKIFGMTASPVDSKTNVRAAAAQLESLLHSHIVTASDPSLLQFAPQAKKEEIAQYHTLCRPFETELYQKIKAQFGEQSVVQKQLTFAKQAASQLGPWCSDQIWLMTLTEEKCKKLEAKVERKFLSKNTAESTEVLNARKAEVSKARQVVLDHSFENPTPSLHCISAKVKTLMDYLKGRFERFTADKCIVFVEQRYTAMLLTELFSYPDIGTPHLRPGFLIGSMSDDVGEVNINFRQQVITLVKFRNGTLNCLFATSVAEEGLDIPDCNLVIRFDLYKTLIQYIQSRGRARLPNSRYIHMMEVQNREHQALVKAAHTDENALRAFCHGLDETRLLAGNSYNMDFFLAKEKKHRVYVDPETGSKLTYRLSLMVLENFVTSLPHIQEGSQSSTYIMVAQGKDFCCEVVLPSNSPISGAVGRPASTKQVAKCSAAFEACMLLRKGGYLDAHFLSTFIKQSLAMQNAHLAVNSKKRAKYDMKTKPKIWSINSVPNELFVTVLQLSDPSQLDRPSQPLALLTRSSLPSFPEFPLYFGGGKQANVVCTTMACPLRVNGHQMARINQFTLRVFQDVFSKEYESDVAKMPYFLVPIQLKSLSLPPSEIIAWDILDFVFENNSIALNFHASDSWFQNRYIVDPYDGSRKLWTVAVSKDKTPLNALPAGVAPRSGARRNNSNILEYSCSLWARSREKRIFRDDQPVIEAELIPLRRNLLDDNNNAEATTSKKCFIVLEPLMISALPTTVVAMAYVFPAIVHRLESYLIALEACELLNLEIQPELALEALTKDSDNTGDPTAEQIQLQSGMGKNYERLEFLGDCFLKMATSISLYSRYPEKDENNYHVDRMVMLCNQNLLNVAVNDKLKLYEYIRSQGFNRRAWYPEGLVLKKGKTALAPTTHDLADKTIADVSEALIGASLLSKGFDQAVRAVRQLVDSEEHPMDCFDEYYKSYTVPKYQTATATASQVDMAMQVEKKHPYHFKYPRLLRSAFTHPSYPWIYEHVPSYQRLEFLGDSLLDMACINFLYHAYPTKDPQWLTEHKMAMVSNQFLGALCVQLGFHKHLLQFNVKLQSLIGTYVDEVTVARESAENDAIKAGKDVSECIPDYWTHTKQPPKCLPDIVEAYIGAMFVDSSYDYSEVERFFDVHIKWYFKDMRIYDTFANKHPVTYLTNFLELNMGCRNFSVCAKELPDLGDGMPPTNVAMVLIHGKKVASKEGQSQRYAKIAVAKMAMENLAGIPLPEFRKEYNCDCRVESVDGEEFDADDDLHGTAM